MLQLLLLRFMPLNVFLSREHASVLSKFQNRKNKKKQIQEQVIFYVFLLFYRHISHLEGVLQFPFLLRYFNFVFSWKLYSTLCIHIYSFIHTYIYHTHTYRKTHSLHRFSINSKTYCQ